MNTDINYVLKQVSRQLKQIDIDEKKDFRKSEIEFWLYMWLYFYKRYETVMHVEHQRVSDKAIYKAITQVMRKTEIYCELQENYREMIDDFFDTFAYDNKYTPTIILFLQPNVLKNRLYNLSLPDIAMLIDDCFD